MALIETAFVTLCALTPSGTYNTACDKAADAATRQVGIRQDDDKYEGIMNNMAVKEARDLVGDKVLMGGAAAFVGYQLSMHQGIGFDTKAPFFCDTIAGNFGGTNTTVTFKWKF